MVRYMKDNTNENMTTKFIQNILMSVRLISLTETTMLLVFSEYLRCF